MKLFFVDFFGKKFSLDKHHMENKSTKNNIETGQKSTITEIALFGQGADDVSEVSIEQGTLQQHRLLVFADFLVEGVFFHVFLCIFFAPPPNEDVHNKKLLKTLTKAFSRKWARTFDFTQTGTSVALKPEFFFIKTLTPGTKSNNKYG